MKNRIIICFIIIYIAITISLAEESCLVQQSINQYWYLKTYTPISKVCFKIQEQSEYLFNIKLEDKQYVFLFKGQLPFKVFLIEPSGNSLEIGSTLDGELVVFENIMEKGDYILKIKSFDKNEIKLEWGTY